MALNDYFRKTGLNSFGSVTRALPYGGGSYSSPVLNQSSGVYAPGSLGSYFQTNGLQNIPGGVTTANAVVKAPIFNAVNQPTVTPPVNTPPAVNRPQAPVGPTISPELMRPDGSLYSPSEVVENKARTLVPPVTSGDVGAYAGSQFSGASQGIPELQNTAAGLNNARNDIATGTTDPYKAGAQSGIAYSPAELKAIEKAYAGIYDPAINSALAKLDMKQKEEAAAVASKQKLVEMAQQHAYTMQEKGLTGTGLGGTYTPGANPSVDAFAEVIYNGKATMATVPKEYKMAVAQALQSYGNQINGKPTTTEIGRNKLTVAKALMTKFTEGKGTSSVGTSRIFGGGIALPGSDQADFYSLGDQLMAMAQLDASKFLKGQGQVSDAERAILANAATSLRYNQSEGEFKKTLQAIIDVLEGNTPAEGSGPMVADSPDGPIEITD